jgi:hypothetical protein
MPLLRKSGVAHPTVVVAGSDSSNPVAVGNNCYNGALTITRPSGTVYSAGDVIGDTNGSAIFTLSGIGPAGGCVKFNNVRFFIYSATPVTTMTTVRMHLYDASPTAIADNAAFDLVASDRASYLDYIDLPTPTDMGSTLVTKVEAPLSSVKLASGSTALYAQLQTITAATFAENSTVMSLRWSTSQASV